VLAAPERVGEWSHEAHCGVAVAIAEMAVGAPFTGRSAIGRQRWIRTDEVVEREPPTAHVFRPVPGGSGATPHAARSRCRPVAGGTEIEQSYAITAPLWWLRVLWLVVPSHRDRVARLSDDLHRLGRVAAR
jgi:hypothetical protein